MQTERKTPEKAELEKRSGIKKVHRGFKTTDGEDTSERTEKGPSNTGEEAAKKGKE